MIKLHFQNTKRKPLEFHGDFDEKFIDKCIDRFLHNKAYAIYSSFTYSAESDSTKYNMSEEQIIEQEWLNAIGIDTENDKRLNSELTCLLCLIYIFNHFTLEKNGNDKTIITEEDAKKYPYLYKALIDYNELMNYQIITEHPNRTTCISPILQVQSTNDSKKVEYGLNPSFTSMVLFSHVLNDHEQKPTLQNFLHLCDCEDIKCIISQAQFQDVVRTKKELLSEKGKNIYDEILNSTVSRFYIKDSSLHIHIV